MAIPPRNSDPGNILDTRRTFFVTTKTHMGRPHLQSDHNATLLVDVVRSSVAARRFQLHDFVIMPDHVHLLLTLSDDITLEKAMQFVKGGFSFRLKRELGYSGEVWQRGFSDHRVNDSRSFDNHRRYIALNPVRAGIVSAPEEFPWLMANLVRKKAAGRVVLGG
jgi:putative transposase